MSSNVDGPDRHPGYFVEGESSGDSRRRRWVRRIWGALTPLALLAPSTAEAQLAPTGGHYAGRASDTGFTGGVTATGDYSASVSLDLPAARGVAGVPVGVTYVGNRFGAAGLGWDVPLSYIAFDTTINHRRPVLGLEGRAELKLVLNGQAVRLVPKGDGWVGQDDPQISVGYVAGETVRHHLVMYDGAGRTFTFRDRGAGTIPGTWFLERIQGTDGSDTVLTYAVRVLPRSASVQSDAVFSVDLIRVDYNPSPTNQPGAPTSDGHWKNAVTFGYGDDAATPFSVATVGDFTFARTRTLLTIDTFACSDASCASSKKLRRHTFNYLPGNDPDTRQPRLQSVTLSGKEGTAEQDQTIPIGTFTFGTATTDGGNGTRKVRYRLDSTLGMPGPASGQPIAKSVVRYPDQSVYGDLVGWDTISGLFDLTGDGRPDLISRYKTNGTWNTFSALNTPSSGFAAVFGDPIFGDAPPPFSCHGTSGCDADRLTIERRDIPKGRRSDVKNSLTFTYRQMIDMNGDGRIDIIDAKEEKGRWVVYLNMPPEAGSLVPRWKRISLDVSALMSELGSGPRWEGQYDIHDYMPLSSSFTASLDRQNVCLHKTLDSSGNPIWEEQNGQYCFDAYHAYQSGAEPFTYYDKQTSGAVTWVEWELRDLNGDGYPDFVFDTNPVYQTLPDILTPDDLLEYIPPGQTYGWGLKGASVYIRGSSTIRAKYNVVGAVGYGNGTPFQTTETVDIRGSGGTIAVPVRRTQVTFTPPYVYPTKGKVDKLTIPLDAGVAMWIDTADDTEVVLPNGWDSVPTGWTQSQQAGFLDVNGDGIADRIETSQAYLGNGTQYGSLVVTLPNAMSVQRNSRIADCYLPNPPPTDDTVVQKNGLRDLNGDSIPDYIEAGPLLSYVRFGTGTGFAGPVVVDSPVGFPLSEADEDCGERKGLESPTHSGTARGMFDVDGDGKPDLLIPNGNNYDVYRLMAGSTLGTPEAGRLVRVDNGYGASTKITYMSAKDKEDVLRDSVPMPEIVVSSVTTVDASNNALSATTSYAYRDPQMIFDSISDGFRFSGYRRTISLTLTNGSEGVAMISDNNGLLDNVDAGPDAAYLRNSLVGRPKAVTTLSGSLGSDPWALVNVDVFSDPRRISAVYYGWNAQHVEEVGGPTCSDVVDPYDFGSTPAHPSQYNPCRTHGFVYQVDVSSWRGSAAPPSNANVQTFSAVLSVDEFGRATKVHDYGDLFRDDDDRCIQTTYATPSPSPVRVLSAVSSVRTYTTADCTGLPISEECFEYDSPNTTTDCSTVNASNPGVVSRGFLTGRSAVIHRADSGASIGTIRLLDATYDSFGNLVTVKMTRDKDGATRTTTMTSYDPFGIVVTGTTATATGGPTTIPTMTASTTVDPFTLETLSVTDANGTQAGAYIDGFGRVRYETVTPLGGSAGIISCTSYNGFTVNSAGRSIARSEYTDPVTFDPSQPLQSCPTGGRSGTTFLDALGRATETDVALGANYTATPTLIVGRRVYDTLGRVVFEADPYTSNEDATNAYGTTQFFNTDGTPSCSVRAHGQQVTLVAATDEAIERYPSCVTRSFANHTVVTTTRDAASLLSGSPQAGVQQISYLTATGRVLERQTFKTSSANSIRDDMLFDYDLSGNVASMSRYDIEAGWELVTTSWKYDSLGRLLELHEPGLLPQYRSYDSWGELVSVRWTDPGTVGADGVIADRLSINNYDAFGRLVHSEEQRDDHSGTITTDPEAVYDYAYDTGVVVPSAGQVTPTNVLGRMARATSPKSAVTFSYDAFGNINAKTYVDDSPIHGGPYIEKQSFHADGSLQAQHFLLPDNSYADEHIDYTFDSAGRVLTATYTDGSNNSKSLYSASTIDGFGRIRAAFFGPVLYNAAYADVGRRMITDVMVTSPVGETREISFAPAGGVVKTFDPVGRERVRTEIKNGDADAQAALRTYDALGRLASVSGTQSTLFGYDSLGNLLTQQFDASNAASDVALSYDNPSQHPNDGLTADRDRVCNIGYGSLTAPPGACQVLYDGMGSIVSMPTADGGIRSFTYGAGGQVRKITNAQASASFYYDAFGGVQQLVVDGTTADTRHDHHFGSSLLLHDEGGASVLTRKFALPDGASATKHGPLSNAKWTFQFGEERGSRFATDESGVFVQDTDYTAYGQPSSAGSASTPGSQLYSSEQWNDGDMLAAFGVSQVGARIYDPVVGRFLSRDPLLIPRTGARTNPYAFAMNDPMNGSDPTGLDGGPEDCGYECNGPPAPDYSDEHRDLTPTEIAANREHWDGIFAMNHENLLSNVGRDLGNARYEGNDFGGLFKRLAAHFGMSESDISTVEGNSQNQAEYRRWKDNAPLWVQTMGGALGYDGFVSNVRHGGFWHRAPLYERVIDGAMNGLLVADALTLAGSLGANRISLALHAFEEGSSEAMGAERVPTHTSDGYRIFAGHGTPDGRRFWFFDQALDVDEAADAFLRNPSLAANPTEPICLVACYTAKDFAPRLAQKMGRTVRGGTDVVLVNPVTGRVSNGGRWFDFTADGQVIPVNRALRKINRGYWQL